MSFSLPFQLFRDLVDNAVDAVIMIDARCRIRYANAALERMVGFGSRELVGEPLNGLLPPAVATRHDDYVRQYLDGFRTSMVLGRVREMQVRHRSGELIPVELKALDLGGGGGDWYFGAFLTDIRERRQLEAKNGALMTQLHQQALTDVLTGLPNRRAFEGEGARQFAAARRAARPIAVGVADIDHFKQVNDTFGHMAGDEVLRAVARALQSGLRQGDYVALIGGEEFGLLFQGATLAEAQVAAERLRASVAGMRVFLGQSAATHAAVSIGVAAAEPGEHMQDALERADRALYQAKRGGRNRAVGWCESLELF